MCGLSRIYQGVLAKRRRMAYNRTTYLIIFGEDNVPMKKLLCLLLALALLFLSACSQQPEENDQQAAQATATPTPEPTHTPEPTVSPTPVPVVAMEDYQYYIVNNTTLAVSFKYPSHWINEPGKASIRYTEPVNAGDTPAQLTVTSKVMDEHPSDRQLRKQLESFLELVQAEVSDYVAEDEMKENVQILGDDSGFRQKYAARDPETDAPITGYALMAYVRSAKRIYLLHFTAPTDQYEEMSAIIDVIRESMTTT